jgi:hypothetical protein
MANGTPRSDSTRTRQGQLQAVKIIQSSWPEFSRSEDNTASGAVDIELDIAGNVFVVEEGGLGGRQSKSSVHAPPQTTVILARHSIWIMNSVEWSTPQLEAGTGAQA